MAKPSRKHHNPVAASVVESQWQVVWHGVAEIDATLVAGHLEADGIRAQVEGARKEYGLLLAGSFEHGDYAVLVSASHADRARDLLARYGEARNVIAPPEPIEDTTAISALRFVIIGLVVLAAVGAIVYVSAF